MGDTGASGVVGAYIIIIFFLVMIVGGFIGLCYILSKWERRRKDEPVQMPNKLKDVDCKMKPFDDRDTPSKS